jgi:hypothetical protein
MNLNSIWRWRSTCHIPKGCSGKLPLLLLLLSQQV